MAKQDWDTVEVFEDGYVYWDGFPMDVGDCCQESESKTGLAYELRHTPIVGRHIVAFKSSGSPDSYLYTVRCNRPGTYYLGPKFGYRKKDVSEECDPVKQVLRKWGVSVDKVHICNSSILVRRSDDKTEPLRGSRLYWYITDAEQIKETDRRFCRVSDILTDFSYVIEVSEEKITSDGLPPARITWLEKIHINERDAETGLNLAAEKIDRIMEANSKIKELINYGRK